MTETETTDDSVVQNNLSLWWERYTGDAYQYERTKLSVLAYLLAKNRNLVDTKIGKDEVRAQQRVQNILHEMSVLREIISIPVAGTGGSFTPYPSSHKV